MTFTVAIAGRPNVGKSTLFNRLTGKRMAIVDDMPGVTRDRREGRANLGPLEFRIFDTAGLDEAEEGTLQSRMTALSQAAIEDADVTLMVIDGKVGVTQMDKHFALIIRKTKKPVILVVNKVESKKGQAGINEAYELNLGDPVPISAEHGEGMADLYEALAPYAEAWEEKEKNTAEKTDIAIPMQMAIVGRPNVGKSTLFNKILGYERTLTGPEAGITRDSIMVECEFEGHRFKLADTAGMRKKSNVSGKIEKLAVADTLEAIRYAQVVVWVVDGNAPLEKQDNHIAALIEQEGRAMVLAVNKWDEIADKDAYLKGIEERLAKVLQQASGLIIVPISAKTGWNVSKLLSACFKAHAVWNKHIGTGELNRWLEAALGGHTPPLVKSRRLKIRYMTQKTARPPTFILFCNISDVPDHYVRYLVGSMRERFDLPGTPIRIKIRTSKNPYADKKND